MVQKYKVINYNEIMMWLRRVLASFLGIIFFIALVATVVSYSANQAFSNPQKIEGWLDQNSLYQNFINNAVSQASQSLGLQQSQVGMTLDSSVIQQAAESAYSKQLFSQSLNKVINNNYQWLEGNINQPNYVINLSAAKQQFISQISSYAQQLVASLPSCTPQQLAAIYAAGGFDALNASCRPASLNTQMIAESVSQKIDSSGFLKNPVITANNISSINFFENSSGQPYYEKFSAAPTVFQFLIKAPWLYAIIAVVSGALMLALIGLRKGTKRIGLVLIAASILLVIFKLVANSTTKVIDRHLINAADSSQLKASLMKFVGQMEHRVTKVDLLFTVFYLILAIIFVLISRYGKRPKRKMPNFQPMEVKANSNDSIVERFSHKQRQAPRVAPEPPHPPEADLPQLTKPKKRRLIQ